MRNRAKFRADPSNHCGDMDVFRFFKMEAVRHLDFLQLRMFNSWYVSEANARHCAEFCGNQSNRSGDKAVFYFSRWRSSAILDFENLEI